jgi:hypothetical protein
VHAHKSFLPPGGSECKRCAVSLSSQCDECTHISHIFRQHVRGFFYSGATTGKPSLRVRELFSTHDGFYATRSIIFLFSFFSTMDATQRVVYFFAQRYTTQRVVSCLFYFTTHFLFLRMQASSESEGYCGVRPSSFGIYMCVCPQLTWPAPPSTAGLDFV